MIEIDDAPERGADMVRVPAREAQQRMVEVEGVRESAPARLTRAADQPAQALGVDEAARMMEQDRRV